MNTHLLAASSFWTNSEGGICRLTGGLSHGNGAKLVRSPTKARIPRNELLGKTCPTIDRGIHLPPPGRQLSAGLSWQCHLGAIAHGGQKTSVGCYQGTRNHLLQGSTREASALRYTQAPPSVKFTSASICCFKGIRRRLTRKTT